MKPYFSSWIANLGVVPWFSFLAFLFLPIFVFLLLLLILVFLVKEPIINILNKLVFNVLRQIYLCHRTHLVKIFLCLLLISSTSHAASKIDSEDFVLSIGEQKSIKIKQLKHFSMGNKEVISAKLLKAENKLFIKAKHLGFSDLIIKEKTGTRKLNFYVFRRQKAQRLMDLINVLKSKGLDLKIHGNFIEMTGEIDELTTYNLIHKFTNTESNVINNLTLKKTLKNEVIAKIYKEIFPFVNSAFKCSAEGIKINCFIRSKTNKFKQLFQSLRARYFVDFFEIPSEKELKNYKVRLKIIQVEGAKGDIASAGLDQIMTSHKDVFERNINALIENNMIHLQKRNLSVNTFAQPETITRIGKESTIELGQEVAFESTNAQNVSNINWKFAGLKIKFTLLNDLGNLILNYTSELSTPIENGVSGSKESSSINLNLDKSYLMFKVHIKTNTNQASKLPWISKVPLLGKLFTSNRDEVTDKTLYAFLKVKEI